MATTIAEEVGEWVALATIILLVSFVFMIRGFEHWQSGPWYHSQDFMAALVTMCASAVCWYKMVMALPPLRN